MTATATLIQPKPCRRCRGTGMYSNMVRRTHLGVPGLCLACDGSGEVEGDPATLAAWKAAREAHEARMAAYHVWEKTQWNPRASDALRGLWLLRDHEPARWEKAVDSIIAGHPAVEAALVDYFEADRAATRARLRACAERVRAERDSQASTAA